MMEDQEYTFEMADDAKVKVWVDENGILQVCAISNATRILVEPKTNGSMAIIAKRTKK